MARNKSEKAAEQLTAMAKAWVAWQGTMHRTERLIAAAHYLQLYRKLPQKMQEEMNEFGEREIYALAGVPYGKE